MIWLFWWYSAYNLSSLCCFTEKKCSFSTITPADFCTETIFLFGVKRFSVYYDELNYSALLYKHWIIVHQVILVVLMFCVWVIMCMRGWLLYVLITSVLIVFWSVSQSSLPKWSRSLVCYTIKRGGLWEMLLAIKFMSLNFALQNFEICRSDVNKTVF